MYRRAVSGLGFMIDNPMPLGPKQFNLPVEPAINKTVDLAMDQLQRKLPEIQQKVLPALFKQAENEVVNRLWPMVQPKLENEVNKTINKVLPTIVLLGLGIVGGIAGSTWYLRREIRKSR